MAVSEFMFILAMLNICFVSFIWNIKQILLLCHCFYEREMDKLTKEEEIIKNKNMT